MEELKFNLRMKEILNQVGDAKYHNLIKKKIEFLENGFREPVKIILIKNNSASEIEKILNAGKVEWKKPEAEFPRTPIAIKMDALNLTEIEFLAVLYLAVPACAGRFALQTTISNNRLIFRNFEFQAIRKPINLQYIT